MQKLFILMNDHLFGLSFMSLDLGDILVKILLCGISEIFLAVFSSTTLQCYDLHLSVLSALNLFYCIV